jgi:hypothetical protein
MRYLNNDDDDDFVCAKVFLLYSTLHTRKRQFLTTVLIVTFHQSSSSQGELFEWIGTNRNEKVATHTSPHPSSYTTTIITIASLKK